MIQSLRSRHQQNRTNIHGKTFVLTESFNLSRSEAELIEAHGRCPLQCPKTYMVIAGEDGSVYSTETRNTDYR